MSRRDSGKRRPPSDRVMTQAAHAGDDPHRFLGAAAPPIFGTSTFVFGSFEEAEEGFARRNEFYVYTRGLNPTVEVAEQKIAAMEGGEAARCFGSGMAAISSAILAFVAAGDHIVCVDTVYGPARQFLTAWLPRFGVETTFVPGLALSDFAEAIRPNTKLIYLESPSSMLFHLQDLAAVAGLARSRGIKTAIDNSYATMVLQRPLNLGIDVVIYTATKYLNGHSDVVAGAVVSDAAIMERIFFQEFALLGGILGPYEAGLLARGLRTLPLRLKHQQESAGRIARFLAGHPKVRQVHYPGLPSHPQYELAQRQMKGASGLLSFDLQTNESGMRRLINALRYFGIGVSWGGHESLVWAPIITQARSVPPAEWTNPTLVRISVGLEDTDDLLTDLERALGTV